MGSCDVSVAAEFALLGVRRVPWRFPVILERWAIRDEGMGRVCDFYASAQAVDSRPVMRPRAIFVICDEDECVPRYAGSAEVVIQLSKTWGHIERGRRRVQVNSHRLKGGGFGNGV